MKKSIQSLRHFLAVQRRVWIGKRNPRKLASINYLGAMKKEMNWESPQDLNEKIMWLKFNSDTTEWTRLADKVGVREEVEKYGYGEYLPKQRLAISFNYLLGGKSLTSSIMEVLIGAQME